MNIKAAAALGQTPGRPFFTGDWYYVNTGCSAAQYGSGIHGDFTGFWNAGGNSGGGDFSQVCSL